MPDIVFDLAPTSILFIELASGVPDLYEDPRSSESVLLLILSGVCGDVIDASPVILVSK